jgi:hypothetical protein
VLDTGLSLPHTVFCVTDLLTYVTTNNLAGPPECFVNKHVETLISRISVYGRVWICIRNRERLFFTLSNRGNEFTNHKTRQFDEVTKIVQDLPWKLGSQPRNSNFVWKPKVY